MKKLLSIVLVASLSSLLLACGGGGGSAGTIEGTTVPSAAARFEFLIGGNLATPNTPIDLVMGDTLDIQVTALDNNNNPRENAQVTVSARPDGVFVPTSESNRTPASGVYAGTVSFNTLQTLPIEVLVTVSVTGTTAITQRINLIAAP